MAQHLDSRPQLRAALSTPPSKRRAPYAEEPGFYEPARIWLYGNVRLLDARLVAVASALGDPHKSHRELQQIEAEAERFVLEGGILVTGIHNAPHQRAAIVPLRWGSPRILVLSGGFHFHLGPRLLDEPFRAARLWRYQFDAHTDLVVSRRAPEKLPTYALWNRSVDRLVEKIAGPQGTAATTFRDPLGLV